MPNFQSSYHPPEGGTRFLTETLLLTTSAANTKADEATLMFGGVAAAVYEAARGTSAPNVPQHLMKTYQDFLMRLQSVAQEFFESHVRGYPPPSQPKKNGSYFTQLNLSGSYQVPYQAAQNHTRTRPLRPKEILARSWPPKLTNPKSRLSLHKLMSDFFVT
ncbi:hypothetical protein K3495_g13001 [Podosphaera aphanis]|nr:hypothetical protein K3495_g13001 [Podosphaera aphanis]